MVEERVLIRLSPLQCLTKDISGQAVYAWKGKTQSSFLPAQCEDSESPPLVISLFSYILSPLLVICPSFCYLVLSV